ncbi:hypothetical protein ACFW6F_25890 [Streptomyces sp. NPDC058746]|uniref:hypothetical protein n=1 Tax=Streptomyces sp. NPDC058746 TaxID=3346622 RepID=UPI00369CDE4F
MRNAAPGLELVQGAGTAPGRPAGADAEPGRATGGRRPARAAGRRLPAFAEVVVSVAAALGYTLLSRYVDVDPMNRIGQVSGLAELQQYVAVIGLPLLALLLYTAHRGSPRRHQLVKRLVCAALAGLATGVIAGGVVVALIGTPSPLGGKHGDAGALTAMANSFLHGEGPSGMYPPAFPLLVAAWAKVRHGGTGGAGYSLHDLQILFSALAGPMAYLAWRLLLRPFWALLVAVPSAVLFLDPIRPYSHIVMIVLLPLLAHCLREMRSAGERSLKSALLRGAGLGAVLGALFLWYSGWFVWSVPGVALLALFLFPWREGPVQRGRALAFVGAVVTTAAVIGAPLLHQMVRLGSGYPDRYAYLSVYADPAYVLGWASDRSGSLTYENWPAPGEMAGQSGFALLLLLGVGLGLGLALRSIVARAAAVVLATAWLLRFSLASDMERAQAVQLYPRTTWLIMYCLMVLAVLGVMALVQRGSGWVERALRRSGPAPARVIPRRVVQQVAAGMVCVVALFATMGASWSVNRYMPSPGESSMGIDAYRAHTLKKADGSCPRYAPVRECLTVSTKNWRPNADEGLWCGGVPADKWPLVCGRESPF